MKFFLAFALIVSVAHAETPALPAPPAAPVAAKKVDLDQLEKSLFPNDNQPLAFDHILVPLEAFLVQRIDQRATKFFKSENVIMVKNAAGEAMYYQVSENARDLLSFLVDKKYKITIVSGLDASVRTGIINAISLPRSGNVALSKVVKTGEIDWTDSYNIKDFGDVNSTIAIGYKGLNIKPADQVVDAGPYFVPYTDYQSAERFRPKSGDTSNYPTDEKAWKAERYKIARVMFTLKQANKNDKATFNAKLQEVNKTKADVLSDYGVAISDGKWTRLAFAWDLSKDKKSVEGCVVEDKVTNKTVQSVSIENCKEALGTRSKFAIDKKSQRVTACEIFTKNGEKIESSSAPASCILGASGLEYAKEYSSQTCSVFTDDGVYITTLKDPSLCGKNNAIYDKKANSWSMYQSFAGMEKLNEADLLKRVSWGWDPRTPLKFQYSLLSMITNDDANNNVKKKIPDDCIAALKKTVASGGHLASRAILKNSLPVEKFPRADTADNTFFHYTKEGATFDGIMKGQRYSDFFQFIRTNLPNFWNWVFYMAADEQSSASGYGNDGYKFTFKPHSLIFFVQGDMPGSEQSGYAAVRDAVKAELLARNPELETCSRIIYYDDNGQSYNGMNILISLAAESSGVAGIAYWGIDNKKGNAGSGAQWLQILGPWKIKSMERIR